MFSEAVLHTVIVLAGIICYVVLTVHGDDGNPVLAASLAWAGGAGTQAAVAKKNGGA